jgi:hypothetical protein
VTFGFLTNMLISQSLSLKTRNAVDQSIFLIYRFGFCLFDSGS